MADFPANVSTGRIHGTVLQWLVDSGDPGSVPDVGPFGSAEIKFTAAIPYALHGSSGTLFVPTPDAIPLEPDGSFDVLLVATDDPDINPTGWTYRVDINAIGAAIPSFDIEVPSDSDRLITELVPVASSAGVLTTQGPPGPSAYDVAVANGFVGTEAEWLDYNIAQAQVGMVASAGSITTIATLTQAAYNLLSPPDPATLYVITG